MKVKVMDRVLAANDAWAAENRNFLKDRGILMLNLIGSPGAGKTALLERTIRLLDGRIALGVIEGDLATTRDAERIREKGAPVLQINTGSACHLSANAVNAALRELCAGKPLRLVFVENVGNLICPAEFDIGEAGKIAVLSVTEGDDKVEKYPLIFSAAAAAVIAKTSLLPHTDFRMEALRKDFRRLNPKAPLIPLDSLTGDGCAAWVEFLIDKMKCLSPGA